MTDTIPDDVLREAEVAALVSLARHGIEPDIQELLTSGNPMRGIRPGALRVALLAAEARGRQKQIEEDAALLYGIATAIRNQGQKT